MGLRNQFSKKNRTTLFSPKEAESSNKTETWLAPDAHQALLESITARRRQLLEIIAAEKAHLAAADKFTRFEIETHIACLEQQLQVLDIHLESLFEAPGDAVSQDSSIQSHIHPDGTVPKLIVSPKTEANECQPKFISSVPSTQVQKSQTQRNLAVPTQGDLASGLKNYWYVVEFSSQVAQDKLYPFELFDQSWILFRDAHGKIACIKDECAHRACPLSLGKTMNGKVQCAYHGWTYDTKGNCIHMPSCQPLKASVTRLPCEEAEGLIWVWPGHEPPNSLPHQSHQLPDGFKIHAELAMDLPVEHGLLLENLLDLAHAPFTHTGTFARGWDPPALVRFVTSAQMPLAGHWDPYPIQMSFEPPCYVLSTIGLRGQSCGKHLNQLHCCLPAGKGRTRLLYRLALDFFGWASVIPGKDWFWRRLARKVIDEDLRLVLGQQKRILMGGDAWKTPVVYDKLGVRYRRWRNQVELASPEWQLDRQ